MELNEQDWDLIDDDGFVRRRLKRTRLDPTVAADATNPPPDPAAEAKAQRERKRNTLLKLKEKYQQEIHKWELLSNTLQALKNRTQNQPPPAVPPVTDHSISVIPESSSEGAHRELSDNLFAQVEVQDVFISKASRLCDVAEAVCDFQEQQMKQPFFDLPIWEPSPKKLMTSLLEE